MEKINEFRFYELSSTIHSLAVLPSDATQKYKEVWFEWMQARDLLMQVLSERPFNVCISAAINLRNTISAVIPNSFGEALTKAQSTAVEDEDIPTHLAYRISKAASEFETVLSAELQSMDTYLVSQKGSYRTPDLIERAEIIFPISIREDLSPETVADVRQAGRCLALDTPTAAGFHLIRAIESVMAAYYAKVLGKEMPTRMRNWGIYIKKLKESGKADPRVTELLTHIKDNYRNPITHPEVMLDSDEVEVLLGVSSAIRQMILELQAVKAREEAEANDASFAAEVLGGELTSAEDAA
jgi:hypothetical protein